MLPDREITREVLNSMAAMLMLATPLKAMAADELTVAQQHTVDQADRALIRLQEIDLRELDDDALARYGEMMTAAKGLTLRSVGPVADAFANDQSAISAIMGPYGSGKTTTAFKKVLNSTVWQKPGRDGVRRARWAVVRDTYGHLEANIMADWFMWFPKTEQNFKQRNNTHQLKMHWPRDDGEMVKLYLEMLFRAVDNQSAEELAKGLALTGCWLNEMDTLHYDTFKFLFPRCGRYRPPGTPLGGWSGLIGDMNAPDVDNWTYDFLMNKNIGLSADEMARMQQQFGQNFRVNFHVQPGGREVNAENLDNLVSGYYDRMQIGMSEQEKRRFVDNKFGAVRSGQPVYPGYRDERHFIENYRPDPAIPIFFGVDGGNTPALVMYQKLPSGQLIAIDEIVIFETDEKKGLRKIGANEFGKTVGQYWNENYGRFSLSVGFGDPAAWYGGSEENEADRDWMSRFVDGFNGKVKGARLKMKPAPVKANRIKPRVETVAELLAADDGGDPMFAITDKCPILRQGFNSGYVYTRVSFSTGGGRWQDTPLKNDFSHVHDANQYGCLGATKFDGWEDKEAAAAKSQRRRGRVKYGSGYFQPQSRPQRRRA